MKIQENECFSIYFIEKNGYIIILLIKKDNIMDNFYEKIEINPDILRGKPIIKGTRISIELIIKLIAQRWTDEQILTEYP